MRAKILQAVTRIFRGLGKEAIKNAPDMAHDLYNEDKKIKNASEKYLENNNSGKKKTSDLIKEDIKSPLPDQIANIKADLKSPAEVLEKYYLKTGGKSKSEDNKDLLHKNREHKKHLSIK